MAHMKQSFYSRELSNLVTQIGIHRQFIKGTLYEKRVKCGKPGCRCSRGQLHKYWCVSYRENKKVRTIYVKESEVENARRLTENYRIIKELVNKISLLNIEYLQNICQGTTLGWVRGEAEKTQP